MYDSREEEEGSETESDDSSEEPAGRPRVLVFATRRNIELLCQSTTWFLDGTFKTAPHIFVQIFTILGLRQRAGRPDDVAALPFVYALLSSKTSDMYAEVLQAVRNAVDQYNVHQCIPE